MYTNPITRLHPTAFVVLIDRSGSMNEKIVFAGTPMTKARAVALIASGFIDELLHRARREGGVRDYYDIAVLGYSGSGVSSLVSPEGEFVSPSRLAARKVRREKIARERTLPSGRSIMTVTENNMWISEEATGATPMCAAMERALALAEKWCRRRENSGSYPPTVINITDGEASDGGEDDIRRLAERIRRTGTSDGNTLLMNIHLAGGGEGLNGGGQVFFPSSPEQLPPLRYARLLWDISSEMPESYRDVVASMSSGGEGSGRATGPFRAVAWNSHIGRLAAMMNIGSVNSTML